MENTFVLGISFKNADVSTRSAFAIPSEKQKECYDLAKSYQFKDFVVLSTCNRTELYGDGNVEHAEKIITTVTNQPKVLLDSFKYVKTSEEALSHIFYVASGLDSQILGDYQILGQFKTACKFSKENGLLGPVFERMANVCIQASKEIKTKTELSKGTVSASYAAIEILKDKIGEGPVKCLLIGTGKFGNKISKNIKHYLPEYKLTVSNRTYSTALEFANANGFAVLPYDQINDRIRDFDVVILSTASNRYIVNPRNLLDAKTKLVLDLSLPQTVHPDCKTMSGVEVLDIDSISAILDKSFENRKIYLPLANEIVHNHIASFVDWNNFHKKSEQIVALKNTLIEFSKYCPHLAKMEEAEKDELVNKTIKSFILNLKEDHSFEFETGKAIDKFMQYAQAN